MRVQGRLNWQYKDAITKQYMILNLSLEIFMAIQLIYYTHQVHFRVLLKL